MSSRSEEGGVPLGHPTPKGMQCWGRALLSQLGRAGVRLSKDEKQAGRGWMALGSSRGCQGALLAKSWFFSCPSPKKPPSFPDFFLSDLGFSYSEDSDLCDHFGFQQLPCMSAEMEAEHGPSPFPK